MKKLNIKTLLTGAVLALMTAGFTACKNKDPDRKKFLNSFSVTTGTISCGVSETEQLQQVLLWLLQENSGGDEKSKR